MALGLLLSAAGCGRVFGTTLTDVTVDAGCGLCLYRQEARGCYWAIAYDDGVYAVNGSVLPKDHDAHGPEGMCRMHRQAVVSGTLRGDQFFAERFDLLPVAPGTPPAAEHAHAH